MDTWNLPSGLVDGETELEVDGPRKLNDRWTSLSFSCLTLRPLDTVLATLATPFSPLIRNSLPLPSPRGAQLESHWCALSAAWVISNAAALFAWLDDVDDAERVR